MFHPQGCVPVAAQNADWISSWCNGQCINGSLHLHGVGAPDFSGD
jgi:hypothetical protein